MVVTKKCMTVKIANTEKRGLETKRCRTELRIKYFSLIVKLHLKHLGLNAHKIYRLYWKL